MWRGATRSKRSAEAGTGYRGHVVGDTLDKWSVVPDTIEIPLMLFSGACAEQDISFVGTIFENFPDPGSKDPVNIHSAAIKLDSQQPAKPGSDGCGGAEKGAFGGRMKDTAVPSGYGQLRRRLR